MEKNSEIANSIFEFIFMVLGLGLFGGLGMLGYQIYMYLRSGEWYSFSVITGLRWLNVQWAFYPKEWIGLYKILDDFPLSLGIFICGFIPLILLCCMTFAYDKYKNQR